MQISTHAPAGGATQSSRTKRARFSLISTHAPAGGATAIELIPPFREVYFYSRPCGRGDLCGAGNYRGALSFLLTPLREGRPSS